MLIGSVCRNNITTPGYKKSGNSRCSTAEYRMPQKCEMPDEFYLFLHSTEFPFSDLGATSAVKGRILHFLRGLDYKNKTNLLETKLSIRSINTLDNFFQSCVFLLMMAFVWRDEGFQTT
jgi:hypothetical protein